MRHLPVVSEKIKMLTTTFVATQIKSITGDATITFCALPTYITNMYKILELNSVHHAGSCATNM